MTPDELSRQLAALSASIGGKAESYPESGFWMSIGSTKLDQQLSELADLFIETPSNLQQMVREAVHPHSLWNLIAYVRRLSVLIAATSEPIWLRRALAVAAIEDGRFDFRDLIVSLVIARSAAEIVGIDPIPHFNWCLDTFQPASRDSFTNARDHAQHDVEDILRNFGPQAAP